MTPLGQLPFFIHYPEGERTVRRLRRRLSVALRAVPTHRRSATLWGRRCSSMLVGHKRYAHIAALRCDGVLPELLGLNKIVSEDAIRRAFKAIDEEEGAAWLRGHLGVLRRTAAGRAVDPRRRYDDQAALWPSGRRGARLQSQEARTSEPLLSHLLDGLDASGTRRRRLSRRRACIQARRAEPVGSARSSAARPVAGCCAATAVSATKAIMREAEARGLAYLVQAASDRRTSSA